jgi:hypothetical protein
MSVQDFDLKALHSALDAQRQARGLTWAQASGEINRVGSWPARHPIATSTITGLRTKALAEGAGVLQMLRWLGRAPESFMQGLSPALAASTLRRRPIETSCGSIRRSCTKRSTRGAALEALPGSRSPSKQAFPSPTCAGSFVAGERRFRASCG